MPTTIDVASTDPPESFATSESTKPLITLAEPDSNDVSLIIAPSGEVSAPQSDVKGNGVALVNGAEHGEDASKVNGISEAVKVNGVNGTHNEAGDETDKEGDKLKEDEKLAEPEVEAGSSPEFTRVDDFYDLTTREWIVKEAGAEPDDKQDKFRKYCFTVYRKFNAEGTASTTTIQVKSKHLKAVGKQILAHVSGVSWHPKTVVVDPETLLAWLPDMEDHLTSLKAKADATEDDLTLQKHLSILIDFLQQEYASTLEQISGLVPNGEITFELLWAILKPRTILHCMCPSTSEPRAVELMTIAKQTPMDEPSYWSLECQYIDAAAPVNKKGSRFGHATLKIKQPNFKGSAKINTLVAFPLKFHSQEEELRAKLVARGRRWMELDGVNHVHYEGIGYSAPACGRPNCHMCKEVRVSLNARVMVDKSTFRRIKPSYPMPYVKGAARIDDGFGYRVIEPVEGDEKKAPEFLAVDKLDDAQLLLTSPILYGFSLTRKMWLEFNVEGVTPIVWNDAAFANLVLPPDQKELIQSLVEVQSRKNNTREAFDDFIEGKGQGLIFNLFGAPGIGKTMSAEATSEHVRKPLYVVGAGDLGTDGDGLDRALTQAFDIAHTWSAVVLLDEADVYLEERQVQDIGRNALVAVFLRQLEYFRGILFLTTNRVRTFDEAFQSRIHVSLHFKELDGTAKRRIWGAFLEKAGLAVGGIRESEWESLAAKRVNGRQIKNCVRTAQALAESKGEKLGYVHLARALAVMEAWQVDFQQSHLYV